MLDNRKTKVIATVGPASETPVVIEGLLKAGVNVVRINLSHGTLEGHDRVISAVREVAGRLTLPVGILMDLQGPKIRTGKLPGGSVEVNSEEEITIIPEGAGGGKGGGGGEVAGAEGACITSAYKHLYRDVDAGDRILIDEGLIELRVKGVSGTRVLCEVITGGVVRERRGMNLPGVDICAPSLTDSDKEGLALGIKRNVDYIALSFVRKASDVRELKEILRAGGNEIPVIAKIEKAEAVEVLPFILDEADGVMIARGDLGVELSSEKVPVLQKKIISMANDADKIVITATQMLESMITNPRPTRAEASDVANAVFDSTDALMLSGETAVGRYPVRTVETMVKIIKEAEDAVFKEERFFKRTRHVPTSFAQAVCYAAHAASAQENSKAIVAFTQTGETALMLSKLRPRVPVIAFTPEQKTLGRLSLIWGVRGFCIKFGEHTDEMICRGEAALLDNSLARLGDTVVIVAGSKVGMRGATNMMKIDWIGSEECRLYLKGDN